MSKKQKNRVPGDGVETLDRISELPDVLLIQILSFADRRCRHIMCSLKEVANYNKLENFISFVDNVLTHSTCSKIKKFKLDFHHTDWKFHSEISQWLNFAVENKVEDVALDAGLCFYPSADDLAYELPLTMYTCSPLITMYLSHWVFDKGLNIDWNSLKSLTLDSIELEADDIVILLSSCPALETLELSFCKRLTLTYPSEPLNGEYDSLEIFAPHLKHLDISGELGDFKCMLVNISSLVIARLAFSICCITDYWNKEDIKEDSCRDYHQVIRNLILDYLQKLSYATELIIGCWFAEVVFMMKVEGVMLPELRCKCLTLELRVSEYNLYGIASLLQTSPLLESLNINITYEYCDPPCQLEQSYFAEVDNINLPSWIPNTVFPNLKNVKIVGCGTRCLKRWSKEGFCKLFELSYFLLKNAVALQKLVIVAKRRKCSTCSENCVSRHLSQLAKKLLDSPRLSTNFVIMYQELA
ncbi:hypothetical protein KY284_022456 [Solanum tuberosum]|nr:hypothetical protein KY284_022456 [Solanum tuberosum]